MEQNVTDQNFAQVLAGNTVVLADFWATWCGPCRALAPTVAQVAQEYDGKVAVVKCNVDECEAVSMQYGIRNIPTLIYFKNGEVVARSVGAVPKSKITETLDTLL